jgi:hypothetical protein
MNQKGLTRLQIILFVSIIVLLVLIGIFFIDFYKSKTRDAIRLADMAVIQSAMNYIYLDQASYTLNQGCEPGSVLTDSSCASKLTQYINLQQVLQDPVGTNLLCTVDNCNERICEYTIGSNFNEDGYKIYFHLETGIEGLSKGCHYLDQEGIH